MILNTSAKNEAWIYDRATDSLFQKSFTSHLTSNVKKGAYETITESMEAFKEEGKKKASEVNFGPLVYDAEHKLFWRFSGEGKTKVLTVFDDELNLLTEELLPENFGIGRKPYFLDGMLYQFLNIDDELAFIRLKPILEE